MAYVDHADWVLFAEAYVHGQTKAPKVYLRVYDCAANKYFLLDAGGNGPQGAVHAQGWCYDGKRKLVYVMMINGAAYALKLNPNSAKLLEEP